jgi:hypothetical protein
VLESEMVERICFMGSRLPLVLHISNLEEWCMQRRGLANIY